uniref:Uncharacterized protein n=1 Tax=Caenorhabditis japonica TaxID=281687 RepID=A0A8R1EQV1_CAEJA
MSTEQKPVEKCICQICQCGKHRCEHVDADLGFGNGIGENQTEYAKQFPAKQVPRERHARSQNATFLSDGNFDGTTINRQDYDRKTVWNLNF